MKFNVSVEEYGNILKTKKSHERFRNKMAEMGFDLKSDKISNDYFNTVNLVKNIVDNNDSYKDLCDKRSFYENDTNNIEYANYGFLRGAAWTII